MSDIRKNDFLVYEKLHEFLKSNGFRPLYVGEKDPYYLRFCEPIESKVIRVNKQDIDIGTFLTFSIGVDIANHYVGDRPFVPGVDKPIITGIHLDMYPLDSIWLYSRDRKISYEAKILPYIFDTVCYNYSFNDLDSKDFEEKVDKAFNDIIKRYTEYKNSWRSSFLDIITNLLKEVDKCLDIRLSDIHDKVKHAGFYRCHINSRDDFFQKEITLDNHFKLFAKISIPHTIYAEYNSMCYSVYFGVIYNGRPIMCFHNSIIETDDIYDLDEYSRVLLLDSFPMFNIIEKALIKEIVKDAEFGRYLRFFDLDKALETIDKDLSMMKSALLSSNEDIELSC